ncbi:alpha/beta hydrolase [Ramlibacter sp. PS4R-6]|uniref:alpha/beta hydrolase n=1 Tax=Ramlibacter sp. PS4R-6 TaxID=3133438 RepID=UPI0030AEFC71
MADLAKCSRPAATLLIMLPGAYTAPERFESEGFVAAVRRERIAADILLVDAHVGYFENRSIVERLSEDVLQPARAYGYAKIWLVGISNGGAAAILTVERVPRAAEGIVLLAPYLGGRSIAQQIRSKGGLRQWEPAIPFDRGDGDQVMWRWLKQHAGDADAAPRPTVPELYLGYGNSDLYVFNHRTLGAAMPPSHVVDTGGGHDWPTWRGLWDRILPLLPLERDATCKG